jgi:hypothetical protein
MQGTLPSLCLFHMQYCFLSVSEFLKHNIAWKVAEDTERFLIKITE